MRIIGHEFGNVVDDHIGARAGREDHRSARGIEDVQSVGGHLAGIVPQADVESWLTAAGLVWWELHVLAGGFQKVNGRLANLRKE